MKMHRYFFCNPVKGYNVRSDQAKPLDDEYREDMLYDTIGDEPGSFFGVVSAEGVTLQFYLEDYDDMVRMEIPAPEEQGSYENLTSAMGGRGIEMRSTKETGAVVREHCGWR
jgi:hypothetical protein